MRSCIIVSIRLNNFNVLFKILPATRADGSAIWSVRRSSFSATEAVLSTAPELAPEVSVV